MRITNISDKSVFQNFYNMQEQYKTHLQTAPSKTTPEKKEHKALIAGAALACSLIPVIAINIKKGRGSELLNTFKDTASTFKDKTKAAFNMIEIEEFPEIFGAATGAVLGGTAAGMINEDNPEHKKAKVKEGTFEFLNTIVPTVFAAGVHAFSKKTGKLTSPIGKAAGIVASVAAGMFVANKTSNKLNEKVFDKNSEHKTKRDFKLTDCLVHIDDAISLLVIAKVPFAKSIHLDKILPLLYARTGLEAGASRCEGSDGDVCPKP